MASGRDSQIRLQVAVPSRGMSTKDKARGSAVTVVQGHELEEAHDRSLWQVIQSRLPYRLEGSPRGARVRSTRSATLAAAEPLLVMDGAKVQGDIHRVLTGIKASDVAKVEIHRGAAGGWEYGYGGENGVIDVTTRMGNETSPERAPESCVRW